MPAYRRMLLNAFIMVVPGAEGLPLIRARLKRRQAATGGTNRARYCYAVWLRHLAMAARHGFDTDPRDVAELGPGDSIGAGLAALLCGASSYSALDTVSYANPRANAAIFEELVKLVRGREPIPDADEFPMMGPRLDDYRFPSDILDEARMARALEPGRLERIRRAIWGEEASRLIRYRAPWLDGSVISPASQDFVFSQAALEHVDALPEAYHAMRVWLRPSGLISHQIDFKSHGYADGWDGHWRCGDLHWKLLRGRSPWFINRKPYSEHLRLIEQAGFRLVFAQPVKTPPTAKRRALAARFRAMPEEDRQTSSAYVLAAAGAA